MLDKYDFKPRELRDSIQQCADVAKVAMIEIRFQLFTPGILSFSGWAARISESHFTERNSKTNRMNQLS
ncbi:hypothetical protein TUM19329_00690 [Legionella antarctica]|uniref:Uncharacterized protein n=2 Tax=Legionella antarctica TaxID=2708020 RepID=A0A6F8SZT1_9GAMM|nr:hypothetical protein TUM19329_00690 [Legionella antarctica]